MPRAASAVAADSNKAKLRKDFIHGVTEALLPHRVAIVAEVEEELPILAAATRGNRIPWTVSEAQHAAEM